ncbi:ester cyclase [Pseudomonas chlororaphis]|uniref:Polyketide cyclase n=1 Tax=Pseudomonas chlororaphis TaxID=587753 RepID=A0A0D5Y123_9PSED|nr:ester cyclase [Pseudomonas chlororaphis]AKA24659.1 polyketide cyclase [Pseudomonas chlororaphis]
MKRLLPLAALALAFTAQAQAAYTEQEQRNKLTVLEFYEQGLNRKNFEAAAPYLGERYIQHNPNAEDGVEGFRKFVAFLKQRYPDSRSEVEQVFVDGDFVILHVRNTGRVPGEIKSIIDIFRLEQGKIVEHWDSIQTVPEKSANPNGMFLGK